MISEQKVILLNNDNLLLSISASDSQIRHSAQVAAFSNAVLTLPSLSVIDQLNEAFSREEKERSTEGINSVTLL